MSPDLQIFLTSKELDNLPSARQALAVLSSEDTTGLLAVLSSWKPAQAIANLLLYPDLIPGPVRFEYLMKGLSDKALAYHQLAAVVGLQRLESSQFSEDQRARVVARLLSQIQSDNVLLASRAAVSVGLYVHRRDAPALVNLLDHPAAAVKHNLLTVLIELVGLRNVRSFINSALESDRVKPAAKIFLKEKLTELEPFLREGTVDRLAFLNSPLSTPLLDYLPNFTDSDTL